jgi:hypothetical protein
MFDDNDEYEYEPDDENFREEDYEGQDISQERFKITEPSNFAKYLGKTVAKESGFEMSEMKKLISVRQIKNYIKEVGQREGKTYSLNVDEIDEVCLRIHEHIIGYGLTKAGAEGMLDMYWDDEQNTMMFSVLPGKIQENVDKRLFREKDEDDNTNDE